MEKKINYWEKFKNENEKELKDILEKVKIEREKTIVYPPEDKVFRVFELCDLYSIKVVILGMDPYINYKQANGIAFAVEEEYNVPPSLKNIFKVSKSKNKDKTLISWVNQGVFLLNTVLTVEAGLSNSHYKLGWQNFTNKVIKEISDKTENTVFMLWGANAQELKKYIDKNKHLILFSTHPSPLGASREGTKCGESFMKANHFEKANEYLKTNSKKEIEW